MRNMKTARGVMILDLMLMIPQAYSALSIKTIQAYLGFRATAFIPARGGGGGIGLTGTLEPAYSKLSPFFFGVSASLWAGVV